MNLKQSFISIIILMFLVGCTSDFTEDEPYNNATEENFYNNADEAFEGLTAIYDGLQHTANRSDIVASEIASDDAFGGGGVDDDNEQLDYDQFTQISSENLTEEIWTNLYRTVYRANTFFENIDRNEDWGEEEPKRNVYKGEAHFLRALSYYRLARLFGNIVVMDSVMPYTDLDLPQTEPEEAYRLIAEDLKFSIDNLPDKTYNGTADFGRVSKYAAETLLAKVYLFYTDYYDEDDLTGVFTKEEVIDDIEDVINNSGHGLLEDFDKLWLAAAYSHGKDAAPEDNNEIIFSIRYNSSGIGRDGANEGNVWSGYIGLRGRDVPPYAQGWGTSPVNPEFYDAFKEGDARRDATIIDIEGEELDFDPVGEFSQRQNTGLYWKKYAAITNEDGVGEVEGDGGSFANDNYIDHIVLRYADALLMAAELNLDSDPGLSKEYLNQVRRRAFQVDDHSHDVEATMENIMKERRLELGLEGERYFDLIRKGMDYAKEKIDHHNGDSDFDVDFRKETGGFFPIPEVELTNDDNLKQNPGW